MPDSSRKSKQRRAKVDGNAIVPIETKKRKRRSHAKQRAEDRAQETAKETTKETTKETAKDLAEEGANEAVKEAVKEPVQESANDLEVRRSIRLPAPEDARPHRSTAKRIAAWGIVLLVLAGALTPVVSWVQYHSRHVTSNNATVRAHLAEIGTRITGVVTSVAVEAGDRVKAGDTLVVLEDGYLRAQVREGKAEIEGLEREIASARLAITHERLSIKQEEEETRAQVVAADAQTTAAKIRAEEAKHVLEVRESLLARSGAISGEDVRKAKSELRIAEAYLAEAQAKNVAARSSNKRTRLSMEGTAVRESRVGIFESGVMRARARLQRAEEQLEATLIRAPEDGAIVRRYVQPGGSVDVGQPIVAMWLGHEVWIEAWIDEDDIGDVRIGAHSTIKLDAFPELELTGVVDKIGLVTDFELPASEVPQPRFQRMRGAPVVGVRIKLGAPPSVLLPGLSAMVAIEKSAS